MKIICEICGAKYSIADEKVKGKVFKIRCKKCQESIVIRGDAQVEEPASQETPVSPPPMPAADAGTNEIETKVFDYSGYQGDDEEAVWHISTDENQQQGPYTTGQILEYMADGIINYETFVWREDFSDWLPIKEVEDLLKFINTGGEQASEPAPTGGGLFDAAPPAADVAGGGLFDEAPSAVDTAASGGLFDAVPSAAGAGGGDIFAAAIGDTASPGDVFSSTDTASEPADGGGLFSGGQDTSDNGGGLFDTEATSSNSSDLFAQAENDDGVFASTDAAPSPRVSAEDAMMTGQRSENSVLFSLSNLQALASGGGSSASMADSADSADSSNVAAPVAFGDEASGLIDIRSMAASLNTEGGAGTIDDLLSLGGGGFAPTLGAPILAAAPQSGMSTGMKIGLIGGGVALLAVLVVLGVFLLQDEEKDTSAQDQKLAALMAELEKMKSAGGNNSVAEEEIRKKIAEQEASKAESMKEAASNADEATKNDNDGNVKKSSVKSSSSSSRKRKSSSRSKSSSGNKSTGSSDESSLSSSSTKPAAASKPKRGSSELDDLLGTASHRSAPKKKKKSSTSASSSSSGGENTPAKLTKKQVMSGMGKVSGSVKRCGRGQSGTVTVKAVISTSGRVTSASTTGKFAGTPAGLCAARAVRRAKFPKTQKQLTVTYPFKF